MPQGTPLTAGADGVVAHKGSGGSGGNTLLLKHVGGMHTVYYHMQRPSPLRVGAAVKTGDVVGYVGTTGASTGPHLHYELRRSRNWGDTLDPAPHIVKPAGIPSPVKPVTPSRPVQTKPVFNRPISADHMDRLTRKFGNFGRRGWFGG